MIEFYRPEAPIWIDDIREPPSADWIVCRTSDDAINALCDYTPTIISFDHDLGGDDTVMRVINQIERWAIMQIIDRFEWRVHSMNPVGRENIKRAMGSIEKIWTEQETK